MRTSIQTLAQSFVMMAFCFTASGAFASPVQPKMEFKGVQTFVTKGLLANVNIQTSEEATDQLTFDISGDDALGEFLENLTITHKNGVLTLEDTSDKDRFKVGSMTSVVDGKIIINALTGETKRIPTVDITLSQNTALTLDASGGRWRVGETHAPFEAVLRGSNTMTVGSLTQGARVNIYGSGSFAASSISGRSIEGNISGSGRLAADSLTVEKAIFTVSGSGEVTLGEGEVSSNFDAHVSGSGNIIFEGHTHAATLKVHGSGIVTIDKVTGQVDQSIAGSGSVKVASRS